MHQKTHARLVLLLLTASSWAVGFAQEKKGEAPATTVVTPAFSWGGDARLRYEAYDGAQTLGSDVPFHIRDYFRFRGRFWAKYEAAPAWTAYGRIAAEPRYWFNNANVAGEGKEWRYALFDNAYLKWTSLPAGKVPTTVVLGRQEIQLGEQWLVGDGTPLDGSWSAFFDAARSTFSVTAIDTKIDAIAFLQQAHPKDHFPILGRQGSYAVAEQDEFAALLYGSNKTIKNLQIDGYAIYKEDRRVTSAGSNGTLYTAGVLVIGTPSPHWQYSLEAAQQWGRRDLPVRLPSPLAGKREVDARGVNARLTYSFKDARSNQLAVIAEYLSGDDPQTSGKDEMFDVLWGRYTRLGETWAVAYTIESGGRVAQYQNLGKIGGTWAVSPTKATSISALYCALFAPEEIPTRSTNGARFSRSGHFRGHQLQAVARHKVTKELSALLFAEAAFLGDFYAQRDAITFFRAELMYTF